MPVAHRFGRIEKVVSRSSLGTNQRERETPSGLLNPRALSRPLARVAKPGNLLNSVQGSPNST